MLVCSNQHHVMLNLSIISSWTNDPINKGSSSIQAINRTILKVPYVHNIVLLVKTLNFFLWWNFKIKFHHKKKPRSVTNRHYLTCADPAQQHHDLLHLFRQLERERWRYSVSKRSMKAQVCKSRTDSFGMTKQKNYAGATLSKPSSLERSKERSMLRGHWRKLTF